MCLNSKVKNPNQTAKRTVLDTLESNGYSSLSKTHETFIGSALRKYETNVRLTSLINVSDKLKDTDWSKRFWTTYHCKHVLIQNGKELAGKLCRKRWCNNCNRVRTAQHVNQYYDILHEVMKQPHFVTLTIPTIEARKLKSGIDNRIKAFRDIVKNLKKTYGITFDGVRVMESTFTKGKYHPHFHVIVDTLELSELIVSLWLDKFPRANRKAQKILRIGTSKSDLLEVFKYSVKETLEHLTYPLYVMYKAFHNRKTVVPYGAIRKGLKKVVKDEVETTKDIDFIKPQFELWIWEQEHKDYTSANYSKLIHTQANQKHYESNQQTNVHTHTESERKTLNVKHKNNQRSETVNTSESTKQRNDSNRVNHDCS